MLAAKPGILLLYEVKNKSLDGDDDHHYLKQKNSEIQATEVDRTDEMGNTLGRLHWKHVRLLPAFLLSFLSSFHFQEKFKIELRWIWHKLKFSWRTI